MIGDEVDGQLTNALTLLIAAPLANNEAWFDRGYAIISREDDPEMAKVGCKVLTGIIARLVTELGRQMNVHPFHVARAAVTWAMSDDDPDLADLIAMEAATQ